MNKLGVIQNYPIGQKGVPMVSEDRKENIVDTYFTIYILDSCFRYSGEVYDEISRKHCPQDLIGACKRVIEMMKDDKDFKDEPKWSYLVVKHEEDKENDWQTFYKVYKYRGKWKCKEVDF